MPYRLALIVAIAFIAYIAIPGLAAVWLAHRRRRQLAAIRSLPGFAGICAGYSDRRLAVKPLSGQSLSGLLLSGQSPATQTKSGTIESPKATEAGLAASLSPTDSAPAQPTPIRLKPSRCRFFTLTDDGQTEPIRWRTVLLIRNDMPIWVIPPAPHHRRTVCVFHECATSERLHATLELARDRGEHVVNPVTPFSVAVGAFAEFLVFFQAMRDPTRKTEAVFALIAIFGKALPYLPPGVLLTVVARLIQGTRAKKSRLRWAIGFALVMLGVLLNVLAVFFVIRRVAFVV